MEIRLKVSEVPSMNLIYSSWIPFNGFYALSLFGCIIRRKAYKGTAVSERVLNEEYHHYLAFNDFIPGASSSKWKMILSHCIGYMWYFVEWLIKVIFSLFTGFKIRAYQSISFEQIITSKGYQNVLNDRKKGDGTKYIFKVVWQK